MHTGIYKLLLVLLSLQGSLATDFYITSPYSAISWKAGEQAKITWDVVQGGVDVNSIDVEILDGDSNNAKVIGVIASGLPANVKSIAWNVPQDFQKTDSAFVRVRGKGPAGVVDRYSHRFSVQEGPLAPAPEQNALKVEKIESKVIFNQQQATSVQATTSTTSTTSTSSTTSDTSSESSTESETSTTKTSKTQTTTRTNNAGSLSVSYFASVVLLIVYLLFN